MPQTTLGMNDNLVYISAMDHASPQSIVFLVFDGFQLLDLTGPSSVYAAANELLGRQAYRINVVAANSGLVSSNSGLTLGCQGMMDFPPAQVDAVFVVGGDFPGITAIMEDRALRDWTRAAAVKAMRLGSICSGSAVLAAWGLIGDRRFATHWSAVPHVRELWPTLNLDPEAIFVEDGRLWTSAGVTTGIDMTLAIVERDHGAELARAVAQRLVLSVRRPGWQSQFSPALTAQSTRAGRYADLVTWIANNLDQPLGVEMLSERAGETLRSFHRNFTAAMGMSPAAFVTRQRVERARTLIVEGEPLKAIARITGYPDVARLSSAFRKVMGMTAHEYRVIHRPKA